MKFIDSKKSAQTFIKPNFKASVLELESYSKKDFKNNLYSNNQNDGNAILLSESKHLKRLYEVIVLKKILLLNPDLKLNIHSFKTGIEIIFPSTESLINNELFIDEDIAKYYYEVNLYYEAFEDKFNQEISPLIK